MSDDKLILCVGMCVIDIIHVCQEFPIEDTDKRCLHGHWQRGGNASNNCTVLRELGAKCEFLGVLSASKEFQYLLEECTQRGIDTENCPRVEKSTPFSSVILNLEKNTRTIVHCNMDFPILKYEDFEKIDLKKYKWVHFEARNPDETTKMINRIVKFNMATENQIKISVELEKMKDENLVLTNHVHYVFLGKDLSNYLGWDNAKEAAIGLRDRIDNKRCVIICPWGADGSVILDSSGQSEIIKAYPPKKMVDTLGAGDTFCAAVIHSLALGKTVKDSVIMGNKIAGFKLGSFGYDHIRNFREIE